MPEKKEMQIEYLRHTLAHLLAAAVMDLWPNAKRAIGPSIENGFYFDFDFSAIGGDADSRRSKRGSTQISENDLPAIEAKMREILPSWTSMDKHLLTADEAKKEYPENPYKHELIDEFSEHGKKKVSFYKSGEYWDLCKGGHLENPAKEIDPDAFKLTHLASAYWRGSEKNQMLTRIYGVAFATKKELDAHLAMLEEAKKRDHKKLGPELDLFTFSELVGAGLPLFTPKGTIIRDLLDAFVWELRKARGYERVDIPHITKKELYETSGHWEKFKDELFKITTREGHEFVMKPMNCPHHTQIYARKQWSYRELPQRYASTTKCYRDEQTGELSGLSRARSFTQDDAHVFCRISQAKEELQKIWEIVHAFYGAVGLTLRLRLSLRDPEHPEKYLGEKILWEKAETILKQIAKENNTEYFEAPGEAAFYAPKLDFLATDSMGREWQVATIQLDVAMPERFDLNCINEEGKDERIVMIHAAIMGSLERFLSILIEHTAGKFPLWLAPVQARVLAVSEKFNEYAKSVREALAAADIRVEMDGANETLGKRIRNAELQKIPYVLVVGEKETQAGTVNIRHYQDKVKGEMSIDTLVERMKKEIAEKDI